MEKKIISPAIRFFRGVSVLTAVILLSGGSVVYGQEPTTTRDVRGYINRIKDKTNEAAIYAEKATNALTWSEAKINAKQAATLLDEAKKAMSDANKSLASVMIPDNNLKYETTIRNITHQLEDLKNKVDWAHLKSSEAAEVNEFEEAKHLSGKAINETKKINNVTLEIQEELTKAEQILTRID